MPCRGAAAGFFFSWLASFGAGAGLCVGAQEGDGGKGEAWGGHKGNRVPWHRIAVFRIGSGARGVVVAQQKSSVHPTEVQ